MPINTISSEIFINHLRDTLSSPDNKLCFILGSGASVESGINSGAKLAVKWYNELSNFHSSKEIAEWKLNVTFDENNIPVFYSKLFKFRYEGHREDGIQEITRIIEKGSPSFGYTILSQIMQRTQHNVVVTTNFDTLTEESLFLFTNKRALVCNHENIAHLAYPSTIRPLIVKIHRGLYMDPLNDDEEISKIKPQWETALTNIFKNYIPIVIGYGGNDGSLMNYLKKISSCQRMYWCLNSEKTPNIDIIEVLKRHNGTFVVTGGFNRLMFRFIDLFELTRVHDIIEILAKERANKLRIQFEEAGRGIATTGTLQEKNELKKVAANFDANDWLQWQLKAMAAINEKEKKSIYMEALSILPQSHQLYNNFAYWLDEWNQYDSAIENYKKALELEPFKYETWINLGISFKKNNQYEDAINAYSKAIEIKSSNNEAWLYLGNLYYKLRKYDEAINAYNKTIELKPENYNAWNNLGCIFNQIGKYEEAIFAFEKGIELKPEKEETFGNLGISYLRTNKIGKAIEAYNKAVLINPNNFKIWYNLGLLYQTNDDLKNAEKCFNQSHILENTIDDSNNKFVN